MEGVNIVQTIVDEGLNISSLWCVVVGCLMFASVMIIEVMEAWNSRQHSYCIGMCVVVLVCFLTIFLAWNDSTPEKAKYVVTVDNSVNFNEFLGKYEIIEKNGEMYTVRMISAATR